MREGEGEGRKVLLIATNLGDVQVAQLLIQTRMHQDISPPAALLDLVWMPSLWTTTSSPSTMILASRSSPVPTQCVSSLLRARLLTRVSYTPKKLDWRQEKTTGACGAQLKTTPHSHASHTTAPSQTTPHSHASHTTAPSQTTPHSHASHTTAPSQTTPHSHASHTTAPSQTTPHSHASHTTAPSQTTPHSHSSHTTAPSQTTPHSHSSHTTAPSQTTPHSHASHTTAPSQTTPHSHASHTTAPSQTTPHSHASHTTAPSQTTPHSHASHTTAPSQTAVPVVREGRELERETTLLTPAAQETRHTASCCYHSNIRHVISMVTFLDSQFGTLYS